MKNKKNIDDNEYLLEVRSGHVNLYNDVVKNFRQSHFILNAGAMSGLSIYLLNYGNLCFPFQFAGIMFFIGTLLSVYAIILDFYCSFSRLSFYDKNFFRARDRISSADLKLKRKNYEEFQYRNLENEDRSLYIRQINGILAFLFFVLGVSTIIFSLLPLSLLPLFLFFSYLFILYFILTMGIIVYSYSIGPYKNIKNE